MTIATETTDSSLDSERYAEVAALVEMMRPAVQADGGDLSLLGVDAVGGVVEVQLKGSCSSCAISSVTLQAGIERIIKGRLKWVNEVVGSVDESADFEESVSLGRGGYIPRKTY